MSEVNVSSSPPVENLAVPERPFTYNALLGLQGRLAIGGNALFPAQTAELTGGIDKTKKPATVALMDKASVRERTAYWNSQQEQDKAAQLTAWKTSVVEKITTLPQSPTGRDHGEFFTKMGINPAQFADGDAQTLYNTYFSKDLAGKGVNIFIENVKHAFTTGGTLNREALKNHLPALQWMAGMFGGNSAEIIAQLLDAEIDNVDQTTFVAARKEKVNALEKHEEDLLKFLTQEETAPVEKIKTPTKQITFPAAERPYKVSPQSDVRVIPQELYVEEARKWAATRASIARITDYGNPNGTFRHDVRKDNPLSAAYGEAGGWKLHLAVDPSNYAKVDEWLDINWPGLYKLLKGGDVGESDFTIYIGDGAVAKEFAVKIEAELGNSLLSMPSNFIKRGHPDLLFSPKVSGRFDLQGTQSHMDLRSYGFKGIPFDSAAAADKIWNNGPADAARLLNASADKIRKILTRSYGDYFTEALENTPATPTLISEVEATEPTIDNSDLWARIPRPKSPIPLPKQNPHQRGDDELIIGTEQHPLVIRNTYAGKSELHRRLDTERSYNIPAIVYLDADVTPEQKTLLEQNLPLIYQELGIPYEFVQFSDSSAAQMISSSLPTRDNGGHLQYGVHSMTLFMNGEDQTTKPHHALVFTNKDIFMDRTNFIIGGAWSDMGTIISLTRLSQIKDKVERDQTLLTEIAHEIGHVYDLPSGRRGQDKLDHHFGGGHCNNPGCCMKQGTDIPKDFIDLTRDRIKRLGHDHYYCADCKGDLKAKFTQTAGS